MKHPKQVGMSCKNTRFKKSGLTKDEVIKVEKVLASDKARWDYLFSINKWTPQKN
jgi:hypothetical protein